MSDLTETDLAGLRYAKKRAEVMALYGERTRTIETICERYRRIAAVSSFHCMTYDKAEMMRANEKAAEIQSRLEMAVNDLNALAVLAVLFF